MSTWLDAVFYAMGIGASVLPPRKSTTSFGGKRPRDPAQVALQPAKKSKTKKTESKKPEKVFCKSKTNSLLKGVLSPAYANHVLTHCENFFVADSEIYEKIVDVVEAIFKEDQALAADAQLSGLERKEIIEAIQRFLRERTLNFGDSVEDERNHIAETSADGKTIHLNRDLSVSFVHADSTETQRKRAVAFGTLKLAHEMMHSLTPFILEMSWQRKREIRKIKTGKKLDLTPEPIGTKETVTKERGRKTKKVIGDMGFALEEKISGGRRFFPRFKLSKIGAIQVAEKNEKGQWIKKSLKKRSEEQLIACVLAPKVDFALLLALCSDIVKDEGEEEGDVDEGEEEGDESENEEFPVIEKYNPRVKS